MTKPRSRPAALIALAAVVRQAKPRRRRPSPRAPAAAAPTDADWRTPDPQNMLVIDTNKGRVIVEMDPLAAPLPWPGCTSWPAPASTTAARSSG